MKVFLMICMMISAAQAQTTIVCSGQPVIPDDLVSVEKIVLNFPQREPLVVHRDMRLEVVGLYSANSEGELNWVEQDEDYFEYVVGPDSIEFEWGREHFGKLQLLEGGKSYQGKITISGELDFFVECQS